MSSSLLRSLKSVTALFRPPFDGLWLAALLYFAWCFLVYPHSQILRGNLPDTDDYMYLTQVLDWLSGQSWYDNVQHRLNPPEGVPIHFSRFAQLPMAALIFLFEKLGLGPKGAATLMALLYPLMLFALFFAVMRWVAESLMPKKWSGVTAYVILFATGSAFMFTPGHVDHHGLIIVLVVLALGCVLRMMERPAEPLWGLAAGLTLAFALTIALEVLPWLLVITAGVGLWAVSKGGVAARNSAVFGLALYVSSLILLLLTRPPGEFFVCDVLTYSLVYVVLTGGIAVAFAAVALTAPLTAWLRFSISGSLAILCGLAFLHRFPELTGGPYGGMDPELAHMMLNEIDEAKPLIHFSHTFHEVALRMANIFLGLGAAFYFMRGAKDRERWSWGLIAALMAVGALLTLFYQQRFIALLGMLAVLPLSALLQRGWLWIGAHKEGRTKTYAELGLLFLVGPLFALLLPALFDGRSFDQVLLFPVDASLYQTPCDTYVLEQILNDPTLYGDRPRLIASSMGQGPEILFRTKHEVLSAPYHMDVSGNIDATRFFSTPYTAEAEAIARRRHIDLVVACRYVPGIYLRAPVLNQTEFAADAKKDTFAPHFIELALTGKAPAWLKPKLFRGLTNFAIFEVMPPQDASQKPRKSK